MKTHLLFLKAFCFTMPILFSGFFSPSNAQEPFVGHYLIPEGFDSKFVAFKPSPQGGYVGVAYGGDAAYRSLHIYRFNGQGGILWTRKYPSPGAYGAINRFPIAADIAPDGGLFILAVQTTPQVQANLVIRTNADGDSLWSKTVSSVDPWSHAPFYAIRTHPEGGCVLAGDKNEYPTPPTVARLGDDGSVMWVRNEFNGDNGYNAFYAIDVSSGGDVFVTGRTQNNQSGNEKALTAKISSQGNIEWSKVFFSGSFTEGDSIMGNGRAIIATPDGGCIFGGWATDPGQWGGRAFIQKLDASGESEWFKNFFRWDYIYQQGATLDFSTHTSGNYLCLIHQFYGNANATPTLMKFNPQGDSLWTQYGAGRRWRMAGTDSNDNILLFGNEPHPDAGWYEHSMVVRTTPGGIFSAPQGLSPADKTEGMTLTPLIQWNSVHRGTFKLQIATDSLFGSLVSEQTGITGTSFIAGNLVSNTIYYWRVQVFGPEGGSSAWGSFLRFKTGDYTGIPDAGIIANNMVIYPNPSKYIAKLSFILNQTQPILISVKNIHGQTIFTDNYGVLSPGEHHYEMNVSDWADGIYLFQLTAATNTFCKKMIVNH